MKKIAFAFFCTFLSLFFMLPVNLSAATDSNKPADGSLKFVDGKFKILVVADIQDSVNVNKHTINLITLALEQEKPDLVVLLGDNVYAPAPMLRFSAKNTMKSIDQIIKPISDAGVPFALVFGNHDGEGAADNALQMEHYMTLPGCLSSPGDALVGTGNYNLLVKDSSGEKNKLNLWFMDSGQEVITPSFGKGYAFVTTEQINWYEQRSAKITAKNDDKQIPAVLFQHIAVPEIYALLEEVPKDTPGAVEGHGAWSKKYYILKEEFAASGTLGEGPCPPDFNNGQFDSWVETGDIMAAVFGHDHVNNFSGKLQGVDLIYTSNAGYYHYGAGNDRSVRVMEFFEDDVENYATETIFYSTLNDGNLPMFVPKLGTMIIGFVSALIATLIVLACGATLLVSNIKRRKKLKSATK